MKAEIISVGTELLLGHTINTDAALVARELASLGLELYHTQVVGDNAQRLLDALNTAASRNDIIITTGGLGPTDDDLTKGTVAKFSGKKLIEDEQSLKKLKEYFGSREMGKNQYNQALKPEDAIVFENAQGTAPGYAVPFGENKFVIMLPGPPSELLPMLEKSVRPFLAGLGQRIIRSTVLRCFGIGEGDAALMLQDLTDQSNPTVATYAGNNEIYIKITSFASSAEEAEAELLPAVREVEKRLGCAIYGRDVPSLEYVVVEKLINNKMSIATAESCTGGMTASRITDCPGASEVFHLGVVAYANEAKEKILGVNPELLKKYGAVSEETARAMAECIRNIAGSDLGIGITGIAGPGGGTPQKPVGLVYIALAYAGGIRIKKMVPAGRYPGREKIRRRASSHALDMVRRYLFNLPES